MKEVFHEQLLLSVFGIKYFKMEKNILNLLASGSKHTKHQNDAEFGRKSYPLNSKKSGGKLSKKVERPSIED